MKTAFALAALATMASAQVIENEWIVTLKPQTKGMAKYRHMSQLDLAEEDILGDWEIGDFNAYAFRGTPNMMMTLMDDDAVLSIEQNQMMHALDACATETAGSWGLARINSVTIPSYATARKDDRAGEGTVSYVIDTGVLITHNDFQGRATWGFNAAGGSNTDVNGHGTHVGGTMVGGNYGIARGGRTKAVKVLGDNGSGSTTGVINGVNWSASDCRREGGVCVGNMSLGGGFSSALNNAVVEAARSSNILMVVAAGNDNRDACNYSPASARGEGVVTVGSTDSSDRRSSFSNFGTCVDIFAPGTGITSAWVGSNSAVRTISGTSMASPHVAGVAQAKAATALNPEQLWQDMKREAASGRIANVGTGSPNELLQWTC